MVGWYVCMEGYLSWKDLGVGRNVTYSILSSRYNKKD